MLFDHFDRIRIVNLPHRTDRRAEMNAQLAKVGLLGDPRVKFFAALSFRDPGPFLRRGSHGAFKSHLTLLNEAASANQSILILQDDCDFLLPDALVYRLPEEWDVFYGGYAASDPSNPRDSDIIGAHFMGFSARAAKAAATYLTAYLESDFPPDPRAAAESGFAPAIIPPIDGALVWFRRAHPEIRTAFAMLSVQRSSRSDIAEQSWFDRTPGIRELAGMARKIVRRIRPNRSAGIRGTYLGWVPKMLSKARDLARFLYLQRVKGFAPPGDEPFMDPEGAARFKQELSRAGRYVEFGSGGTTVLADRAGIESVSIENDRFYARSVASRLQGNGVRQTVVSMGLNREWGFPLFPSPDKAWTYVSAPFGGDPFPDFILVDGRYRVACALESARQAKQRRRSATLMFDDYGLRPHYHCVEEYLGAPEMAGRTALFQIGSQTVPSAAVKKALEDCR